MKNGVVLLASLLFYAFGAPKFIFVILGSTILDFFIVKWMHATEEKRKRKQLLISSLALNLGLLAYFKYANFFVENVDAFLQHLGFQEVGWTNVALPIGISFYTFQTLTYALDIYRKDHEPLQKLTDYLLYIMSFPQMIAGPIVRFTAIAKDITDRKEVLDDKLLGFYRFCIGLGKKVLIANVLGEQATLLMEGDISLLSTQAAWVGIIAYTFQIYFDFSGYSDMAIGLGRIMGFKFPENFNSPYISQSITEFWRRWHITLGSFMRDYLYIPLGGSKVKTKQRLYFNLWIVFLLSGLWHGASWNFILWGIFHGFFLVIERVFLGQILEKIGRIPSTLFTFLITMLGWVIFKLETVSDIPLYFGKMFSYHSSEKLFMALPDFKFTLVIAIVFSVVTAFKWGRKLEHTIYFQPSLKLSGYASFGLFAGIVLFLSAASIVSSDFNPFIYFRF
ncbi:MAG: MBOAT family O-acyltransferase [Flavobacteriales bacterium]|nr:MBOAT family O-acyltransferase [Flavobacteriales bacterium]MDG1779759.1 MBOAT family O-acyltransferase [Flavobacteriales bacterium]MDG2245514.1 MBOAT family O-acyltransferase [Flavobacteriales bacterium]